MKYFCLTQSQPFQPITMDRHGESGNNTEKNMLFSWQEIILPNSRTTPNKLRTSTSSLKSKQASSPLHVLFCLPFAFITGAKSTSLINLIMLFQILLLLSPLPIISLFSLPRPKPKMYPGSA